MLTPPGAAALAFAALVAAPPAFATVAVPPAPHHKAPTPPYQTIGEAQAREIAWRNGLLIVEEISRMGHVWALAGRDREGLELVVDIDGRDGTVLR
jgi:hypothetical protein